MAIITISRGTYSGGKKLAECLGEKLGYRLLSREQLLLDAAREFGVSEEDLESALLHKPGFLEGVSLQRIHYISFVQSSLAREVRNDKVVYHGQAGHLLLKNIPHHLRLKVMASMESRIAAAMEQNNFSRDKAIQYIKRMDEDRDKWVKAMYGVDRNDPSTYDLIINLEHITLNSACELVGEIIKRNFQTTREGQQAMDNLVLSSRVRARIAATKNIVDDNVEVEAKDGTVILTGTARSSVDADKIREIVRSTPGAENIDSRMGIRW